jgi:predicted transcriptional regulator
MTTQLAASETDEVKPYMDRWGGALRDGYLLIPRALLLHQGELGISTEEVVVLQNLLASWWQKDDLPYPAVSTLAHRMRVSVRTVQRHLNSLEAKGFIERVRNVEGNGRASALKVTRYALAGTVQKLTQAVNLPAAPRPVRPRMPSKYNAGRTVRPSALEVFGGLES